MAIQDDKQYSLSGGQVKKIVQEIKESDAAFKPFPDSVVTDGTTEQFMNSILALGEPVGTAFLGTVNLSDLPAGLVQEEVAVYVYSDYVVYCDVKSTDVAPYEWWCASYNYQGWRPVNTDTTYSAGTGLELAGTTFSVDTTTIQEKLDSTQMNAVNSGIDSTKVAQIATNTGNITTINGKIPAQATSSNQLADKDFVNSSIATNTANFIGTFNSVAELEVYSGAVTNNDYAFVIVTDAQGNTAYDRYKYNGSTSTWLFEYELNNSSFTANQWASINSGITSGDVSKLAGIAAGAEVNVQSNWNESDTSSDAYIQNKPTIPTVNNATLTITQNGTSVGTFTANASTDATIALTDTTYSAFTGATASTAGTVGLVPAPAAGDESKVLKGNGTWAVPDAGIKTLTTADYNWPTTGTKTQINFALMPAGVYTMEPGLKFIYGNFDGATKTSAYTGIAIKVGGDNANTSRLIWNIGGNNPWYSQTGSNESVLLTTPVVNSLTSTLTTDALSANQGRVLKDLIDSIAIRGAGAPTPSTVGTVGQLYEDGTNGDLYQLKSIDTSVTPNTYTWEEIGNGPTVVQTTGDSVTNVMSQKAVTSMIFKDPVDRDGVQIGKNSNITSYSDSISIGKTAQVSGNAGVAIGSYAGGSSSPKGSISLGAYAKASEQGQMNIGLGNATTTLLAQYGYNGTAYRLLSGLYDPQTAHDAATKGYADTKATITMTTTDPGEGAATTANTLTAVYS